NHVLLEKDLPSDLPPVRCDPELMKIVFVNLLSNAVKYGMVRGRVKISASAAGGIMTLKVWNQGPGFPGSEKKNLFKKFSRLQTAELKGRKGSGIGLYMSWKTVMAHGGAIRAASEEGQWAEFTVELPTGGPES
ncbi:MAG TPA: HAMP domain-containing histidine kinase, partial [Spirochaetes bacterium]|nr:HAMP domain-containing histidine kinase [Spirochaetota bacterium]